MGLGKAVSSRDLLELPTSIASPFHQIELEFNENHLVTKMINSVTGDKEFEYDALSQLKQENEIKYRFDALGNSKEFAVNELNQIVGEDFAYDSNGNLLQQKEKKYLYDALDRLDTIIDEDGTKTHLEYDPLSRLVKKIEREEETLYLYDGDTEIGSTTSAKEIQELKVLGLGLQGDIGAAIAIEIQGEVFIPLHDLQGNILAIINQHGNVFEEYPMNAFGEGKREPFINPWRFSSKRSLSDLVYFGMRFYQASLKRWLTPDPAGFTDSQNLYQFNHASPVNRLDQFGLRSEHTYQTPKVSPIVYEMNKDLDRWMRPKIPTQIVFFGPKEFEHSLNRHPNNAEYAYTETAKLAEKTERQLGFSYQNGIFGDYQDFLKMGQFLHELSPDTPIIGVYNPPVLGEEKMLNAQDYPAYAMRSICMHNGQLVIYNLIARKIPDILRAGLEYCGWNTNGSNRIAHFLTNLQEKLSEHPPNTKWVHKPHSESVIQLNRAYAKLPHETQKEIKQTWIIEAIAPGALAPKENYLDAINNYANLDFCTGWNRPLAFFSSQFKMNIVESQTYNPVKEHGYLGPTYRKLLTENMKIKYGENWLHEKNQSR